MLWSLFYWVNHIAWDIDHLEFDHIIWRLTCAQITFIYAQEIHDNTLSYI